MNLREISEETVADHTESLDFSEIESESWRKYQRRRFYQERGHWMLTSHKMKNFKSWILIIITGFLIACIGALVILFTDTLFQFKFDTMQREMNNNRNYGGALGTYLSWNILYSCCAGMLCYFIPSAAGSGIPEIKAFLNGVKLDSPLSISVLVAKTIGMCLSVAASLPLGKEGPMIHVGSIMGGVISQGWPNYFNSCLPWATFQDFRNDLTRRDFITIGAAAGVAAAFRAPIGGILFTLEEGASFWSLPLTIRAFICAAITQLTISLLFTNSSGLIAGAFAFGQFDTLIDGTPNYYTYELFLFILIGAGGGCLGALFNHINLKTTALRMTYVSPHRWKRFVELMALTIIVTLVTFILCCMWQICTPIPDINYSAQETSLYGDLVRFQCDSGYYNEVASLFLTPADVAMQQLFHFREVNGMGHSSFSYGSLILFFTAYFGLAAVTPGILAPSGLFIPTLTAGAVYGRFIGHFMNYVAPGSVAASGTYALIGAASVLGGMSRMTISGTVIILEACGNTSYLLPLMLTFTLARYVGYKFNHSFYETQLILLKHPFLEGELPELGLINYEYASKVMSTPVVTLREVDSVRNVVDALKSSPHNAFPVVREGKLCGLIVRKTLCQLLKHKAFSSYSDSNTITAEVELRSHATVLYDSLEKDYPNYPNVDDIVVTDSDKVRCSHRLIECVLMY